MGRKQLHKRMMYVVVCTVALAFSATWLFGADAEYVGASKCKFCHKAESEHWMSTPHAKAFDTLKADEQQKEACVGCHVTGHGKPAAAGAELNGVQCEACHGPGSLYKKLMIKKSAWKEDKEGMRAEAAKVGLVIPPTEETCTGCHNSKNPNPKEFVFKDRIMKVKHTTGEACK